MKKRIFALLFALVFFASFLSGCAVKEKTEDADLDGYRIVYPEICYGMEKEAAEFLSDYLSAAAGLTLPVISDMATETKKEILIGGTNRTESSGASRLNFKKNSTLVKKDGDKIVLYGEGLMLAGAVGRFCSDFVKDRPPDDPETGSLSPEDIESFIEVRGIQTSDALKDYKTADAKNVILLIGDGMGFNHIGWTKSLNPELIFFPELLPNQGSSKTDSLDGTTDSAAGGTALSGGYKTKNNYVGMDGNGIARKNIREVAQEKGYKTAVVTTDAVYGATPADFTAHVLHRNNDQASIKAQQQALKDEGKITYLVGTNTSHTAPGGYDMYGDVRKALFAIREGDGFFAMLEEDDIDDYSHNKNPTMMRASVERFNKSIGYAFTFALAHPGTAVIVTADHETGGITKNANGSYAYMSGAIPIPHTSADTPVFAFGKGTEIFSGKAVENTDIAAYMGRVYGIENFGIY
jgi:alkaline phosphatase